MLRVGDLLGYPEPRFVVHHRIEILEIPLDLDIEFVGSSCVADAWGNLVQVFLHQADILANPVVDSHMGDFYALASARTSGRCGRTRQ